MIFGNLEFANGNAISNWTLQFINCCAFRSTLMLIGGINVRGLLLILQSYQVKRIADSQTRFSNKTRENPRHYCALSQFLRPQ